MPSGDVPVETVTAAGTASPTDQPEADGTYLRRMCAAGIPETAIGPCRPRRARWRAGWAPDELVYVDADLQGAAQPAPPGRLTSVLPAEGAMQSDPGALTMLVLWLQVLVAGASGAAWAQARWGGAQAWLVGLPVILAALWGASEAAMQLLPNLL